MRKDDHHPQNIIEDVIDLRDLIQILLNGKWIILCVTLILTVLIFLTSYFLIPKKYEASVYIFIAETGSRSNLNLESLAYLAQSGPVNKEITELLSLAEKDDVKLVVTVQGNRLIELQVTANDPEQASEIANIWANTTVRVLNNLLLPGIYTVQYLESEVENAQTSWNQAQQVLAAYLPQSQLEILELRFADGQDSFRSISTNMDLNSQLIRDAETLIIQHIELNANDPLPADMALSIIALQQRASGPIEGSQFQFDGEKFLGNGTTIAEGIARIETLIAALMSQTINLESELTLLEESISAVVVNLEREKHQVEVLTLERYLARELYTNLTTQLEETRIELEQFEDPAQIGANAIVPSEPSSPRVLLNTCLAGIFGLFSSAMGILIFQWWTEPQKQ